MIDVRASDTGWNRSEAVASAVLMSVKAVEVSLVHVSTYICGMLGLLKQCVEWLKYCGTLEQTIGRN